MNKYNFYFVCFSKKGCNLFEVFKNKHCIFVFLWKTYLGGNRCVKEAFFKCNHGDCIIVDFV